MTKLGIDLGTSNTLAAYISDSGNPEIVNIDNKNMIPSVVYFEEGGGNVLVGDLALEMYVDSQYNPNNSFRRWKLLMGEKDKEGEIKLGQIIPGDNRSTPIDITPEYLTTLMIEHVIKTISSGIGGKNIDEILITVPHGWRREKPEKCKATRNAAEKALFKGKPVKVQPTVSEPVAAAAYWIWERNKALKSDDELKNKSVLVCDIGGGTFDVSLIKVGGEKSYLDVVNAINNNYAGDYADALICAEVSKYCNENHNTRYPESAEQILKCIENNEVDILRGWMQTANEKIKKYLSDASRYMNINKIKPTKKEFMYDEDTVLNIKFGLKDDPSLNVVGIERILEPFYEKNRDMLKKFISEEPYAVVLCGGGSKIFGVMEHIIIPVLSELYGREKAVEISNRFDINLGKADQAIALGAALIANKKITIQERLLYDIGMVIGITADLSQKLGLKNGDQDVLLMPVLKKGQVLPAKFNSKDYGIEGSITDAVNNTFEVKVVVDDGIGQPTEDKISITADIRRQNITWSFIADQEGNLHIYINSANGELVEVTGRYEKEKNINQYIQVKGRSEGAVYTRITLDKLKNALT